jgi:hypothetical protein
VTIIALTATTPTGRAMSVFSTSDEGAKSDTASPRSQSFRPLWASVYSPASVFSIAPAGANKPPNPPVPPTNGVKAASPPPVPEPCQKTLDARGQFTVDAHRILPGCRCYRKHRQHLGTPPGHPGSAATRAGTGQPLAIPSGGGLFVPGPRCCDNKAPPSAPTENRTKSQCLHAVDIDNAQW